MKRVKIGVIGRGCRGSGLMETMVLTDKYEFIMICDKYEDRAENGVKFVKEKLGYEPKGTTNYHEVLANPEVEAVLISCDWEMHIPIAIDAMRAGKAIALEVGGAYSVDECYKLVEEWEKARVPFMFLENCCYNKDELLCLNMAKAGKLGRIVYASGSYSHDLRGEVTGGKENRHYRLRNYLNRNCENYPTHELGPMAKILDINRGNQMVSLVSMGTLSWGMEQFVEDRRDTINPELIGADFAQADIIHTIIKCANGETMVLKLDTSLPRSYSREFQVRGTKGLYEQDINAVYFDGQPEFWSRVQYVDCYKNSAEKYKSMLPDAWKVITQEALDAGHGGMDYVELREFVDRLKDGREMAVDVYDAAAWMVVTCLSEESIKCGGKVMEIPDFTKGKWKTRPSQDVLEFNEYVEE